MSTEENNDENGRIRQEKLDAKQKEIVEKLDNISLKEVKESKEEANVIGDWPRIDCLFAFNFSFSISLLGSFRTMFFLIKILLSILLIMGIFTFSNYTFVYSEHVGEWIDAQIFKIQDDRNRYSIVYPLIPTFTHTIHNKFDKLSYDTEISGGLYPMLLTFYYNFSVPIDVTTNEEFMTFWENRLQDKFETYERNLTKYTIDNQPVASLITTTYDDENKQLVSLYLFLVDKNKNTLVSYYSTADSFEHYLPLAEQIIQSIKFSN